MPFSFSAIASAALFSASLSIDAFTAGFAYGSKLIRIPMKSVQIINVICSTVLGLSMLAGSLVSSVLPPWLAIAVSFTVLFIIGATKLLDGITKSIIQKHAGIRKEMHFSMFNFKFILHLYADPEAADADGTKDISVTEAAALALSLSLDGAAAGFGAALTQTNVAAVVLFSLITDTLAVTLGHKLGGKLASRLTRNVSWLGGAVLIGIAVSKLITQG